jgi:DNA-binding response OmpR family regulator
MRAATAWWGRKKIQMLKVLIAEDELMIADLLEEFLTEQGFEICGIARTVDEAVALGELHKPDLAVLDVRLAKGGYGQDVARRLKTRGRLGVLFATADGRKNTLVRSDGEASITKPYRLEDVERALKIVHEIASGGTATVPFPPGFRLLEEASVSQLRETCA